MLIEPMRFFRGLIVSFIFIISYSLFIDFIHGIVCTYNVPLSLTLFPRSHLILGAFPQCYGQTQTPQPGASPFSTTTLNREKYHVLSFHVIHYNLTLKMIFAGFLPFIQVGWLINEPIESSCDKK